MVYPSKKDPWLVVLFAIALLAMLFVEPAVLLFGPPGVPVLLTVFLLCLPVVAALLIWAFFTTSYEIAEPDLIIRAGPLRGRIPLRSIVAAYPSHNPLSAPAWSLDRIRIDYVNARGKRRFGLISPQDKQAFLSDLAQAADLRLEGDRAVRP